jgi:hypothetical protein
MWMRAVRERKGMSMATARLTMPEKRFLLAF